MNHHVDVSVERDPSHNGILLLRQNMRPGDLIHQDWIDVAFERVPDLLARIKEATGIPEDPRPPIFYLGSPYSHEDGVVRAGRHRQVCEAAARLFERGIYTYSPIAHTVAINELGGLNEAAFEFWRAFDLGMVDRLTGLMVLMLPGWRHSAGLTAEIEHARATGKPVLWCEPAIDAARRVTGYRLYESEPAQEEDGGPDLCGVIDESDFEDEDDAECELPAGHAGPHFARVEGGLNAYWTTDGSDVLTGEQPDEDDELRPCLASMGVHDCVRPQGHDGPHACDDECDAPDHLHESEAVEAEA